MNKNEEFEFIKNEEVNVVGIAKLLYSNKRFIYKVVAVFCVIGLLVALFSKKEYTASTTFVPQVSDTKVGGSIGGLAAMAGINLGGLTDDNSISPILYPQIMNSLPYKLEMLKTPLTIKGHDSLVPFDEYYTNVYKKGVFELLKQYTIGLPGYVISAVKKNFNNKSNLSNNQSGILFVSEEEDKLIERLEYLIDLEVNDEDGYVDLYATMPEDIASAQLVQNAQKLLQKFIIDFRIQKSKEQLEYIKKRYEDVELKFIEVQLKLAEFEDKNKYVNTAKSKIELQTIQDEYNLIYGVYLELAKQLEAQYIKVTEDTPVFTVLKPVNVPLEKSKPRRALILLTFVFLGAGVAVCYILLQVGYEKLKIKWHES